ncbi:hypothetical protein JCM10908_000934 [Rhodotorula pacifica]|uniref:MBL fold metallo-hydrolase n=1 Tax=Rhodotorula pacifica TaxID=1495444 RepID=UPI00317D631B
MSASYASSDPYSSSDEGYCSDAPPPAAAKPSSSSSSPQSKLSFTFLGTGGSSALPLISCVTKPDQACSSCFDTIWDPNSRNIRANTGGVIRVPQSDGGEATILLDCGKTFRETALKWFVLKKFRRIDACILTHLHADAIDGLDDLRAWTYDCAIEKTIPIYCTRTTYDAIATGFPYMISKAAASGSGKVPSFDWHIMPEDQDWKICGVTITPFPFHHGHYFSRGSAQKPLICSAFLIDSSILYISDASYIPEEQWTRLATYCVLPSQNGIFPSPSLSNHPAKRPLPRLQAVIIDVGGVLTSTPSSHLGLPHAIAISRRLGALRTYLTDFQHGDAHQTWLEWCVRFGRGETSQRGQEGRRMNGKVIPAWRTWYEGEKPPPSLSSQSSASSTSEQSTGLNNNGEGFIRRAFEAVEDWAGGVLPGRWVRPAFDGLTIEWERWGEGRSGADWSLERVKDDEY